MQGEVMSEYAYRGTTIANLPANVLGKEMERITKQGKGALSPEDLVRAARPKRSVLNKHFEWDDSVAGEKYRVTQARTMIRHIYRVVEESTKENRFVRAWLSPEPGPGRTFVPVTRIMNDKALRDKLLAQAYRDLESWAQKYRDLKELAGILAEIDKLGETEMPD